MTTLNFNAEEVQPAAGFDVLPVGEYLAVATASENKVTKDGSGEYLQFVFTVIDGQYKNRKLFARFNMKNKNQTAVEIARAQLSTFCRAVGVMHPKMTEDLHNIPVKIKVKVRPASGEYAASNDVTDFKKADGSAINTTVGTQTKVGDSPVSKRPWEK